MVDHRFFSTSLAGILLASANVSLAPENASASWQIVPQSGLPALLDCVEAADATLISAHRGGPSPGLPENAIETMDAVLAAIPAIMEVDVAQSSDGVHYLMHDRTLDRTTNGTGAVTDQPWPYVQKLRLVDEAGWVTQYRVPTLEQTLDWAKGRTVLQVDFKRTADYAAVTGAIKARGMSQQVILIAYSIEAALRLHSLAPEMLISLSIDAPGELDSAVAAGVPADRIVAFTGTRTARPDLYRALDTADVEVIFGTLGRSPSSIDNVIDRFGTDERYAELGEGGVDIIATDRPRAAAAALKAAQRLPVSGQCGVAKGAVE